MTMTRTQARARLKHLLDNTLLDTAEDDQAVRAILDEIADLERWQAAAVSSREVRDEFIRDLEARLLLPPEDARRISVMFNRASSLRTDQDRRLNAWLKDFIVACEMSRHSPDAPRADTAQAPDAIAQSPVPPSVL